MAITPITKDMNIIAALADLPNSTDGLSAAQLKAKFDEGGASLKAYINDILIPTLSSTTNGSSGASQIGASSVSGLAGNTVQSLIESLKAYADSISVGAVPDGSIVDSKLGNGPGDIKARFTNHRNQTARDTTPPHGMGKAAAEDYEEGIWTPFLSFGSSVTGITYSSQSGRYTKVGNVVHWEARILLSNKGTAVGIARLDGLPFISASGLPNTATALAYHDNITYPTGVSSLQLFLTNSTTSFRLRGNGSGVIGTDLTNVHLANNTVIVAGGSYAI